MCICRCDPVQSTETERRRSTSGDSVWLLSRPSLVVVNRTFGPDSLSPYCLKQVSRELTGQWTGERERRNQLFGHASPCWLRDYCERFNNWYYITLTFCARTQRCPARSRSFWTPRPVRTAPSLCSGNLLSANEALPFLSFIWRVSFVYSLKTKLREFAKC